MHIVLKVLYPGLLLSPLVFCSLFGLPQRAYARDGIAIIVDGVESWGPTVLDAHGQPTWPDLTLKLKTVTIERLSRITDPLTMMDFGFPEEMRSVGPQHVTDHSALAASQVYVRPTGQPDPKELRSRAVSAKIANLAGTKHAITFAGDMENFRGKMILIDRSNLPEPPAPRSLTTAQTIQRHLRQQETAGTEHQAETSSYLAHDRPLESPERKRARSTRESPDRLAPGTPATLILTPKQLTPGSSAGGAQDTPGTALTLTSPEVVRNGQDLEAHLPSHVDPQLLHRRKADQAAAYDPGEPWSIHRQYPEDLHPPTVEPIMSSSRLLFAPSPKKSDKTR